MRFALGLSEIRGHLKPIDRASIMKLLNRVSLPALPKNFGFDAFMEKMNQDKKIRDGKIHFVLLKKLGQSVSDNQVTSGDLKKAFALLQREAVT